MSDSSEDEADKTLGGASSAKELANFLAKVDEIGDLVRDLAVSSDKESSSEAIKKADSYLKNEAKAVATSGKDRTIINRGTPRRSDVRREPECTAHAQSAAPSGSADNMGEFYKAVEEDAHERAERRKEREKAGKELKKKGTEAFRREEFEEAADLYSRAIKETPWDISLYTNMALCHNKLEKFEEAIEACDRVLRFETPTVRAYVHKGRALASLKRYQEARGCYQEAIKQFPTEKEQLESYLEELECLQHS